jgi:hypothetical protein
MGNGPDSWPSSAIPTRGEELVPLLREYLLQFRHRTYGTAGGYGGVIDLSLGYWVMACTQTSEMPRSVCSASVVAVESPSQRSEQHRTRRMLPTRIDVSSDRADGT